MSHFLSSLELTQASLDMLLAFLQRSYRLNSLPFKEIVFMNKGVGIGSHLLNKTDICGSAVMAFAWIPGEIVICGVTHKLSPFPKHLQSFLMPGSSELVANCHWCGFLYSPAITAIGSCGDRDLQLLSSEISFSKSGVLLLNFVWGMLA